MTLRYVLWDFGDTLVDQDWMLTAPEGYPDWPEAWCEAARGDTADAWYRNELSCEDIARRVSESLGMPLADTMNHIRRCCGDLRFFERPWKFAQACALPQAIVTVNPDLFSRYVVPAYELDQVFSVLVTSWEAKTVDKAELCSQALERLGGGSPDEALLIDNLEDNVRGWERAGGIGYVYRGEAQFVLDMAGGLGGLFRADS